VQTINWIHTTDQLTWTLQCTVHKLPHLLEALHQLVVVARGLPHFLAGLLWCGVRRGVGLRGL
jgi:hypothetical protein